MRALRKYAFLAWGPWRSSKPKLSQQAVCAESKRKAPPILPKIIEPPRIPEEGSPIWKNCAFLVDKPTGFTSHDVCAKLKVALNAPKIGHAGTLDMMATGLLVVCVGKGTKSSDFFMAQRKVYSGVLKLGEATPSYDTETEVCQREPWEHLTDKMLQDAADKHFTGELQQVPPMYSAVQVDGQRMYRAARDGKVIKRDPRPVSVFKFKVWRDSPNSPLVDYWIECSKGTYIRSLIHDLGQRVGSCAHAQKIRRESSGDFSVKDAWCLDELVKQGWEAGLPRPKRTKRFVRNYIQDSQRGERGS